MPTVALVTTPHAGFAPRLRTIINEPKRRMLLNANTVWSEANPGRPATDRAVFETTSERFHRTAIAFWELYDDQAALMECLTEFARVGRAIREKYRYSIVVTSTAMARLLAKELQDEIERDDDPLTLRHLGPFPFVTKDFGVPTFNGERVLLLADVMDSGKALWNLAKAVTALGGKPVAALCLAMINEKLIRRWEETGEQPVVRPADDSGDGLPLYPLTTYPVIEANVGEFDEDKVIRLDPETQLPITLSQLPLIRPAIGTARMYQQFEEANAIVCDLFKTETGLVTTAIHMPRLFEKVGEAIWTAVKPHLTKETADPMEDFRDTVLVTTYDRGDLRFKQFVDDRLLKASGRTLEAVLIGRRQDGEYFLLDQRARQLLNQHVVLLLSSAQTAQKIRDLAALLASLSVRSIRVVCLLNRMGPQTAYFVGRIARLMRGLGTDGDADGPPAVHPGNVAQPTEKPKTDGDVHVPFFFHPIYNLVDLSADRLGAILDTIRSLFDYYEGETRVASFRRWLAQVRVYFTPKLVTSHEFSVRVPEKLKKPQTILGPNDTRYEVTTEDALLSSLAAHVVTDRKYDAIIDELAGATERREIYKLFALLLSDVGYMKKTRQFAILRNRLEARLEYLRTEGIEIERAAVSRALTTEEVRRIDQAVDLQTHLIFGWALVSFLDQNYDYTKLVFNVLSGGFANPADWREYPVTFERYYGEERLTWVVSFLLLLSHPGSGRSNRATELKEKLTAYVRGLVEELPRILRRPVSGMSEAVDQVTSRELRVKSNLGMLLTEFGAHDLSEPIQVIRFLHSQLLKPKQRHSPIDTNLNQVIEGLDRVVRKAAMGGQQRRIPFTDNEAVSRLDDGIYIAGQLQMMVDPASRLLFFDAPMDPADAKTNDISTARYFTARVPEPGFAADVAQLGESLQRIRSGKRVSIAELIQLTQLRTRLQAALWDDSSALRKALYRYVTPLEPTLAAALDAVKRLFKGQKFEKVWNDEHKRFTKSPPAVTHYVLVDPLLLKEILKNIFTNVRYNLIGYDKPDKVHYKELVEIGIEDAEPVLVLGTGELLPRIRIRVVTKGKKYKPRDQDRPAETTLEQHKAQIAKVGGELHIRPYNGKHFHGTETEVLLIARTEYRYALPSNGGDSK